MKSFVALVCTIAVGCGGSVGSGDQGTQSHRLDLTVSGSGTVRSTPAGIDCGATCSAPFASGTSIALTAIPAQGYSFAGWDGACSGAAACTVAMKADAGVTARFVAGLPRPPPPPPADECAGLMPSALPAPVVATLPQNDCLQGTSDDGTGNFLLGFSAGGGADYPNYLFFIIDNGQAVRVGGVVPGGDESSTAVYSQPSGFTSFHRYGGGGDASAMMNWAHDGAPISIQVVAPADFRHTSTSAVGIDPSGGTATLLHSWDAATGQWQTSYRRYDKTGAAQTGAVIIDHRFPASAAAIVVALSGDALAIEDTGAANEFVAQWLTKDGTPIGASFTLVGEGSLVPQWLTDGSVVVGFGGSVAYVPEVRWTYRIADGVAATSPAPGWLTQRPGDLFWPIRGRRGYAMVGSSMCGSGAVEIIGSGSGMSCGCMRVPDARRSATVGRDGSLIVPHATGQFGTCHYDLYPRLLQ